MVQRKYAIGGGDRKIDFAKILSEKTSGKSIFLAGVFEKLTNFGKFYEEIE